MVLITGDTHCIYEISRLSSQSRNKLKVLYIIICGNSGIIWANDRSEKYWLNWLEKKPFHTLFVDENHENFSLINALPIEKWNKGRVHVVRKNILHLMRGNIFEIEGKRYFAFGGGFSDDIERHVEGESWWKEELHSIQEMEEGLSNLDSAKWEVDFIITHTAPSSIIKKFFRHKDAEKRIDQISEYLEGIMRKVRFTKWFFGNFPKDVNINGSFFSLYKRVIRIY